MVDGQPLRIFSQILVWDYRPHSQPITSQTANLLPLFELKNIYFVCDSHLPYLRLRLQPFPSPSVNLLLTQARPTLICRFSFALVICRQHIGLTQTEKSGKSLRVSNRLCVLKEQQRNAKTKRIIMGHRKCSQLYKKKQTVCIALVTCGAS